MSELESSAMGFPALNQDTSVDTRVEPAAPMGGGFKKRAKTSSLQKSLRKPAPTVPTVSHSDDDEDSDQSGNGQPTRSTDVIAGRKRKRGGGIIQAASTRKSTKEEIGVVY